MSRLPEIEFISELPKSSGRTPQLTTGWVVYVIAKLEARPNEWARIGAENANSKNVKLTCEKLGIDVDVKTIDHVLYMKLNA